MSPHPSDRPATGHNGRSYSPAKQTPAPGNTPPAGNIPATTVILDSLADSACLAPPSLPIQQLKQYHLLELIGRGGMGDVYRAYDEMFHREVAVKVLPAELAQDKAFVHRFQREARLIAGLSHPHIVPVYTADDDQGHSFYAMQFIQGEPLSEHLRREGRFSVQATLKIILPCLSALDVAHKQGLIHRDIKPGNIMLQAGSDHPYLVDFGLVRRIDDHSMLTITGLVMGTVDYMAPEQARGQKQIDARTDLYSMGAMLYHMLAGRLPFESNTFSGMLYSHAYETPFPLEHAAPDLPRELVDLIKRMMAKNPDDRPANCFEVIEALRPLQQLDFRSQHLAAQVEELSTSKVDFNPDVAWQKLPTSTSPWQRMQDHARTLFRRRAPAFIQELQSTEQQLAQVVSAGERRCRRLQLLLAEGRALREELLAQQLLETSSTGSSEEQSQRAVQIAQLDQHLTELTREYENLSAAQLAMVARRDVLMARLASVQSPRSWQKHSPRIIGLIASSFLLVGVGIFWWHGTNHAILPGLGNRDTIPDSDPGPIRTSPTTPRQLQIVGKLNLHKALIHGLQFTPNGDHALSISGDQSVKYWNFATGDVIHSFHGGEMLHALDISHDGQVAATGGAAFSIKLWDLQSGRPLGELQGHQGRIRAVRFTPTTRYLISTSTDKTLRVWDLETQKELRQFKPENDKSFELAVSPDNRWIACHSGLGKTLLIDAQSWTISKLAISGQGVSFSPDSQWLAVGHTLVSIPAGQLRQSFDQQAGAKPTFSPDGKHLFFNDARKRSITVCRIEDGQEIARWDSASYVTNYLAVAPNGRYLICGGGLNPSPWKPDGDYGIRILETPASMWPANSQPIAFAPAITSLNQTTLADSQRRDDQELYQLTGAIVANPSDPSLYLKRGRWHAIHQDWPEAKLDYEQYLKLQPNDIAATQQLAEICIGLGETNTKHYQAVYQHLLSIPRGRWTLDAVRTITLSALPEGVDPAEVKAAALRSSQSGSMPTAVFLPGVHYRCGEWETCVAINSKANPNGPWGMWGVPKSLFHAMALEKIGRSEEAKTLLSRVRRIVEEGGLLPYPDRISLSGRRSYYANDSLQAQILYREASELILGTSDELTIPAAIDAIPGP